MSNYLDITIYDFDSICRTCLSREDLKPLYEKRSRSGCPAEMLMACSFVKFTEDDGLPVKICTNCIHEINQAFSFVKHCEATDKILRKCVTICKNELANNSSESQTVETKEEVEIKPEIIDQTVRDVLDDYKFVEEIKQEVDEPIEYVEVKQEVVQIENEYVGNCNNPADESYEEDVDVNHDETYSEKSDNPGSTFRCRSTNSKMEHESSNEKDGSPSAKKAKLSNEILSRDFKCTICNRVYATKRTLQQHSRIHREKKFECGDCGNRFKTISSLKYHSKIHTGVRPYACEVCGKAFCQLGNLNTHKQIHTGEKPHVCSVCSKAFTQSSSLNDHMKIHTGMQPYSCEVCGKRFSRIQSLTIHHRIHTGEKPNVCSVCSKAFTYLTTLNRHMIIHTGVIKPYSCEVCGKSFAFSRDLTNHKRIHTGEKPNVCSVCSKAFSLLGHLKTHMRIHTGEKPYSCSICTKTFNENRNLKNHMRIHNQKIPIPV